MTPAPYYLWSQWNAENDTTSHGVLFIFHTWCVRLKHGGTQLAAVGSKHRSRKSKVPTPSGPKISLLTE